MLLFAALLLLGQTPETDCDAECLVERLSADLRSGEIDVEGSVKEFRSLDKGEQARFLDLWRMQRDPPRGAHSLYQRLAGIGPKVPLEILERREQRSIEQARDDQRDRLLYMLEHEKSVAGAWALSFFVGLGIGNFYVNHSTYGVCTLLGEVLGAVVVFVGVSNNDPTMVGLGALVNRSSWLADWIGAILNAEDYNAHLMAQAFGVAPLRPSGLAFAF